MINNFLKDRKSQGHVEMITSFIIFIGFIFALFYFINPLKTQDVSQSKLDRIQERILENLTLDYKQISLILNQTIDGSASEPCFFISDSLDIEDNMIVTDSNKKILTSYKEDGRTDIGLSTPSYTGGRNYNIYFSDSFNLYPLDPLECSSLSDLGAKGEFGILNERKSILFENIGLLNDIYLSDYQSLKKGLKIDTDFNFVVYDGNRKVIYNESLNTHGGLYARNMLSRDIPLKAIDKNATEHNIILNLRIW